MIDRSLFALDALLDVLLYDRSTVEWRERADIVPNYMPPHARADMRPKCVVRWGNWFLRYSAGPRQGYFWDTYGDDFGSPECALIALCRSEPPPSLFRPETYSKEPGA